MIKARSSVENMTAYLPPLEARRGLIRLDFNENTEGFPWASPGLPTELVATYPEYGECEKALAEHWNLGTENILLTDGSDEGLLVVGLTFIEPGVGRAVITRPTFALIRQYLQLVDAQLTEVPLTGGLEFDCGAIAAALGGVNLALFASPDNPTGAVLDQDCVINWCRNFPDTLFIIDEAYAEYTGKTLVPLVRQRENLMVLRSFSKAWGMAGLRLGAAIGPKRLIDYMRRVRSPYSVNGAAVATVMNLLKRSHEIHSAAQGTMARKKWLTGEVQQRGYRVHSGGGNFFLVSVGADARAWCDYCRRQGVLVRDRSSLPALSGMVRVSVGTERENRIFLDALDAYRRSHALIFDLDDTLVDCSQSYARVVSELVRRYSGTPLRDGELNALRAEGGYNDEWDATQELLRRRRVAVTRQEIAREGESRYLGIAAKREKWNLSDDIVARLRLRYRLLVLTGRTRAEYVPVWGEHTDSRFEHVWCRDDFNGLQPKPAPDMLLAVLDRMKLEGAIYIGNSVDDMRAAREAGLGRVAVRSTTSDRALYDAGAEYIVDNVNNLNEVILV